MNKVKDVNLRKPHTGINVGELGELNARVVRRIQAMSTAELFDTVVAAGIYTSDGKLTKEYGGTPAKR